MVLAIRTMGLAAARAESTVCSFVTIAGLGPGTANSTNRAARFNYPSGVAVENEASVYVLTACLICFAYLSQ